MTKRRLLALALALVVWAGLTLACTPPTPIVDGPATATVAAQRTRVVAEGGTWSDEGE